MAMWQQERAEHPGTKIKVVVTAPQNYAGDGSSGGTVVVAAVQALVAQHRALLRNVNYLDIKHQDGLQALQAVRKSFKSVLDMAKTVGAPQLPHASNYLSACQGTGSTNLLPFYLLGLEVDGEGAAELEGSSAVDELSLPAVSGALVLALQIIAPRYLCDQINLCVNDVQQYPKGHPGSTGCPGPDDEQLQGCRRCDTQACAFACTN